MNAWIAKAGIQKLDAKGRRVDFHAIRHTFNTQLLVAGVPLQHAQKLMRHTDPKLTANAYADVDHLPLAENVAKVRALATPQASDKFRGDLGAKGVTGRHSAGLTRNYKEPQECINRSALPAVFAISQDNRAEEKRAGDGIRTHDVQLGKIHRHNIEIRTNARIFQ